MGQPVIKGALVECARCGVQRVLIPHLVLRVGIHDGRAAIRYRCQECGRICLRPIGAEQASSMAATTITIEWWEPPHEVHEHSGAEITEEQVRAFERLLADDRAFAGVVATLAADLGPDELSSVPDRWSRSTQRRSTGS
jgi:hypothetical protein